MKCPECKDEAATIREGATISTAMMHDTFWKNDVRHFHDPNTHTTNYSCSCGHHWTTSRKFSCGAPDCDLGEEQ